MFYGRYLEPVEIGAGSFGTVYQALEPKVGRYVALKESACGKSSSASILVQRMKAEYELIKQLKHDNIVPVFDFIASEDGYVIISMELASGGSLREMLRKNRFRLYESTVRTYAKAALRGLEYLHGRGVLHCDIKPENLVLNGATLKLCDFGLSKQCRGTSADGHRTMNISGTPRYMAPELWDTNTYTQASDIWALGCTLAELATGCSPWEGSIKKDAHDFAVMFFVHGLLSNPAAYDPNKIVPGHLSRPFRQMLHGMLSLDATQRPTATQCLQSVYFEENEGWRDEEGIEDEDTYDEQLMKAHSTPAGSKDFTFSVDEGSPTSTTTESQTTKALGSVASIPATVAQSTVVHFSDALTTRTSARRSTATLPPTERSQPTSEVMRAPQIATADAEVVEPMWVFQNGRQVVQYDDQAQKLIEAAFQAKQETVEVATIRLLDGLMGRYEINFAKMRQRNMATGYLRKVERWTCAKKPELLRKANRRGFTEDSQKSK